MDYIKLKAFLGNILKQYKLNFLAIIVILYFYFRYAKSSAALISTNNYTNYTIFFFLFFELSFEHLKDLILFPIYNKSMFLLKIQKLKENITELSSENLATYLQRSTSIKYFFKEFFSFLKELILIATFASAIYNKYYFLLIIIYAIVYYILQKNSIFMRNQAWNNSNTATQIATNSLSQTYAIKQKLLTLDETITAFEQEQKSWGRYYLYSNIYSITLIGFSFIFFNLSIFFLLILNRFIKKLQLMLNTFADLSIFFTQEKEKVTKYNSNLVIKDLVIEFENKILGPLNFTLTEKITIIKGENGSGKTSLALAITNLLPYKGTILRPTTLYINSESKLLNKELSKGEHAKIIIKQALNNQAELIILDETLDILSENNLNEILKQIESSTKKFIIITHKNLPYPTYNLESFQLKK